MSYLFLSTMKVLLTNIYYTNIITCFYLKISIFIFRPFRYMGIFGTTLYEITVNRDTSYSNEEIQSRPW